MTPFDPQAAARAARVLRARLAETGGPETAALERALGDLLDRAEAGLTGPEEVPGGRLVLDGPLAGTGVEAAWSELMVAAGGHDLGGFGAFVASLRDRS